MIGGAELQMTVVGRLLAQRGLRVAQIVYPHRRLASSSEGVAVVQRAPSSVGRSGGPIKEWNAIWRALHRASASTYVHRTAGPEVALTASYCRTAGARFIYSSSSTKEFTGEGLARPHRDRALFRFGLRLADLVVVQTAEQEALARAQGVDGKVEVIPSVAQRPYDHGDARNSGRLHFLWAGGVSTFKRPEIFVDLAQALPEARFEMVLARRDSHHSFGVKGLRERAEGIPNLSLHEAMPRDQLMALIARAVAVVNTSVAEGMPNTFLEGWARGVPALSYVVDPDGVIASRGLGVVAQGDPEQLLGGARTLWRDRSVGLEAGRRARLFVAERHDPDLVGEQWMRVLR